MISLELFRLRTGVEVEHRLRGELLADILSGASPGSRPLREAPIGWATISPAPTSPSSDNSM
ncbi:hypothetical protein [Streptomyces sp900116325]|uniref:hypothetical protein n=1 Tax=Streptomyces sp. 900116325 TaxID=3154295 RepID=UPI0033AD7CAC